MTTPAWDDQAEAATHELTDRLGETAGTLRTGSTLGAKIEQALNLALHQRKVCPHVRRGPRPAFLDAWRGVLTCGRCSLPEQRQPLPGDQDHRCDLCNRLQPDGWPTDRGRQVIVRTGGFVVTAFALCDRCAEVVEVDAIQRRKEIGA